jgi:hypothetical protein
MAETRNVCTDLVGEPENNRSLVGCRRLCEKSIKMDLKVIRCGR